MKDKPFIITNDEETADMLRSAGFALVSQSDGYFFFENDPERIRHYAQHKFDFTDRLFI